MARTHCTAHVTLMNAGCSARSNKALQPLVDVEDTSVSMQTEGLFSYWTNLLRWLKSVRSAEVWDKKSDKVDVAVSQREEGQWRSDGSISLDPFGSLFQ